MSRINSQSLTIVGGSGFIGKSIIDSFNGIFIFSSNSTIAPLLSDDDDECIIVITHFPFNAYHWSIIPITTTMYAFTNDNGTTNGPTNTAKITIRWL